MNLTESIELFRGIDEGELMPGDPKPINVKAGGLHVVLSPFADRKKVSVEWQKTPSLLSTAELRQIAKKLVAATKNLK